MADIPTWQFWNVLCLSMGNQQAVRNVSFLPPFRGSDFQFPLSQLSPNALLLDLLGVKQNSVEDEASAEQLRLSSYGVLDMATWRG